MSPNEVETSTDRFQKLDVFLLGVFLAHTLELLPSVVLVLGCEVERACRQSPIYQRICRPTWGGTRVVTLVGLFEVGVELSSVRGSDFRVWANSRRVAGPEMA